MWEFCSSTFDFSCIWTDNKDFKYINDIYGHSFGDEVLKQFARRISDVVKGLKQSIIARYSGNEFIILLENCSEKEVDKISKIIKNNIEENIKYDNSLSVGYSTLNSVTDDVNLLTRQAEKALYKNKLLNKNSIYNNTLLLLSRTLFV